MNILPHKSWHVRTKKNIARVRKDEAEAAEKEKEKERRAQLAEQEVRTGLLRQRATQRLTEAASSSSVDVGTEDLTIALAPVTDIIQKDGHVNFFLDMEDGKKQGGVNEEAEEEKKKEQEEYEKKIGYLVYLGQDSLEANKQRAWYSSVDRASASDTKVKESFDKIKAFENSGYLEGLNTKKCDLTQEELKLAKFRNFQDPLNDIRKYLKTPSIAKKLEEGKFKDKKKKEEPLLLSSRKRERSRSKSPEPKKKKKKKKDKDKKKKKDKKHHKSSKSKSKHSKSEKKHKPESKPSSNQFATSSSSSSEDEDVKMLKTLENLRAERLRREREERRRTEQLLAKLRGDKLPEEKEPEMATDKERNGSNNTNSYDIPSRRVKQKYNAQFNPELARQNYDN